MNHLDIVIAIAVLASLLGVALCTLAVCALAMQLGNDDTEEQRWARSGVWDFALYAVALLIMVVDLIVTTPW